MCGGTVVALVAGLVYMGLSPRVRGNQITTHPVEVDGGSIPACAGEPFGVASLSLFRRVYPRVCGGTRYTVFILIGRRGLSPRVRGNPF